MTLVTRSPQPSQEGPPAELSARGFTEAEEIDAMRASAEAANIDIAEFVLPGSHHVVLRGMRFHYLDWGGSGRPLLFLHGGGLNAHTYDLVCLALRSSYRCISLDQRGHGDTEWSPVLDYGLAAHAADTAAFINHQGWEKSVLVGMSMGGLNAIVYAGQHSDRLAGLVIIDVGPDLRLAGTDRIRTFMSQTAARDSIEEFVQQALAFNPRRDPVLLRRSLLHNLRQQPDGRWAWKYDRRQMEAATSQKPRANPHQQLWDDVAGIKCPTSVVRGANSDVFHDEDAEKLVAALADGRWVKVPAAGHTVQGDNPAALCHELRRFLNSISY